MANDFTVLSAEVDTVASEIATVVAILQNPTTDNNDQATIDEITARLTAAGDALKAALPAPEVPTPAPDAGGTEATDGTETTAPDGEVA